MSVFLTVGTAIASASAAPMFHVPSTSIDAQPSAPAADKIYYCRYGRCYHRHYGYRPYNYPRYYGYRPYYYPRFGLF